MSKIIVMGGSGGLGSAVMKLFPDADDWSLQTGVDFGSEASIIHAAAVLQEEAAQVTGIINCAGRNFIAPFDHLRPEAVMELIKVNALALVCVLQHLRAFKMIKSGAAICNVISNAAHMPMTHSLAYNASKAAQEIITRQMARELKEYCIFGVNPNKLEGTGMSIEIESAVVKLRGWTPEEAKRYQLAALPAGVETPPHAVAKFIAELMKPIHHPFITGCIFPYGGPQ